MICPRCGNEFSDTKGTCPSCGFTPDNAVKQDSQTRSKRRSQRTGGLSKPSFGSRPSPKTPAIPEYPNKKPETDEPSNTEPVPDVSQPIGHASEFSTANQFEIQDTGIESSSALDTNSSDDMNGEATPTDILNNHNGYDVQDETLPDILDEEDSKGKRKSRKQKKEKTKKEKKKRLSKGMRIFLWSAVAALIIGGGVGAHFFVRAQYKTWPRMFKVVFGIGQTQVYPVEVEAVTGSDGFPAHKFTIRGENPDVAVLHGFTIPGSEPLTFDQPLTFIDGTTSFTIPDSCFIPKTVTSEAETITIEANFAILDNRGNETPVPCDPVVIDIPQTVVTNLTPAETEVLTYQDKIDVSLNVLDGSTLTVNGEDYTSEITDGAFSKSIPVEMGENTIEIVVTTPYYRAFTHTVTVTRTLPPVGITVEKEPASRTEDKTVTITGTFEKGASLKLTGSGRLSYSKSKATFTITLSMSSLGLYEGTLTATLDGKSDGVYNYRVERIPDATDYQKAATAPDVTELFADFSEFKGDKLKLNGTVSAADGDSLTLSLGESQDLTFAYYGDTIVSIGDMVTVYGEIQSVTDNVPTCYAWFVVF